MSLLLFFGFLAFIVVVTVVGGVIVMTALEDKTTLPRFVCAGFAFTVPLFLIFSILVVRDYLQAGFVSQDLIALGAPVLVGFTTAAFLASLHYAGKVWEHYVGR